MADQITASVTFRGNILKYTDEMEKAKNTALERTGAWIQETLRKLIRPSSSGLAPGKPPRGHASGHSGLKDVRFKVDRLNDFVVAGPRIYGQSNRSDKNRRGQTRQVISSNVPKLLDEGGTVKILISYPKSGHTYVRTVNYRAFPWITPTQRRAKGKLLDFLDEAGFNPNR